MAPPESCRGPRPGFKRPGTSGPIFSFGIGGGSGGYGVGLGAGIPFGGSSGYPEIVSRFTRLLSPEGAEELSFDFAMGMR